MSLCIKNAGGDVREKFESVELNAEVDRCSAVVRCCELS